MRTVTQVQPRRHSLVALFLDGEWAADIDKETWLRSGLRVGQTLSEDDLEDLMERSQMHRANEKALYLLEYRSHSKRELVEKIRPLYGEEAAQAAADRMEEIGLVNDEEFARQYAQQLLERKRLAPSRAVFELTRKGIDRELAQELVEELCEDDPQDVIRAIVERKYARCLSDEKGLRRTVQGLQRMGYRYEDIRSVLRDWEEEWE